MEQHRRQSLRHDGPCRVQPAGQSKVRPHVFDMAAPTVVLHTYLLANDGYADVFDQEPGDFPKSNDVDRLHLSRARYAPHALGNCSPDTVWRWTDGPRCTLSPRAWKSSSDA